MYKPLSPREIASIVEDLVKLPRFAVVAQLKDGRLLLYGMKGRAASLYALDPDSKSIEELVEPGIYTYASKTYGASRIIVGRDISKGAEKIMLYLVDPSKPKEEKAITEMKAARILGVADDGETIAFVLATDKEVAVYAHRRDELWKVGQLPGVGWVTHVKGDLIVGAGMLAGNPSTMELFIANTSTGELRIYTPKEGATSRAPVITSKGVLFQSNFEKGMFRLYLFNPETDELQEYKAPSRELEEFKPVEYTYYHEAPTGEVVVIAEKEARTRIFVDGKKVEGPDGTYSTALLIDGKIYATFSSLKKPTRILMIKGSNTITEVYAPHEPEWLTKRLGEVKHVYVTSFDGLKIPTLVLENTSTKPGPAVVLVHGGPFSNYSDSFNLFAAALAGLGLHVVMPNYRGSTGYGEEFRQLIIGDPCGGELEDIVAAAKWAKDKGLADRLIVMGYSYGGYMTLCALTRKPGVFDCGVAGAAVADWEEMYELSDAAFKKFIEIITGGKRELWSERSPINYVENIEKPLCIIQPQNDTRTPLKPILRLMYRLLETGKAFEAHITPDMGHVIYTVEDAEKILLPALLFINRCLAKIYGEGAIQH